MKNTFPYGHMSNAIFALVRNAPDARINVAAPHIPILATNFSAR